MLQIVMQLSAASRITSYSYSFHPRTFSSMSTCRMREYARPRAAMCSNSSGSWATPLPVPPRV